MNIDPLLTEIVKMGYEKGNRIPIWVTLPGCIVAGIVTTQTDGLNIIMDGLGAAADDESRPQKQDSEGDAEESDHDPHHIYLRDVLVINGPTRIRNPIAMIDLTKVGAWGVGSLSTSPP